MTLPQQAPSISTIHIYLSSSTIIIRVKNILQTINNPTKTMTDNLAVEQAANLPRRGRASSGERDNRLLVRPFHFLSHSPPPFSLKYLY